MAVTVTHSKTLVSPSTGVEDKVYGVDYVSTTSHTLNGLGTNVETWLETPSSANLASAVTGETGSGALVFATGATLTGEILAAGSTTVAPLTFTSGTNLTTAAAGVMEFDGTTFYATAAASSRQVIVAEQFANLHADFTLANAITAQNWLPAANDTFTVEASTAYAFEALIVIEDMGTGSHTTGTLFAGTATFTSIGYHSISHSAANNGSATAQATKFSNVATASTVVPATTVASSVILMKGTMRINGGGTLIPQIIFSVDPTGTILCKKNSYFKLWPIGSDAVAAVGNVA